MITNELTEAPNRDINGPGGLMTQRCELLMQEQDRFIKLIRKGEGINELLILRQYLVIDLIREPFGVN